MSLHYIMRLPIKIILLLKFYTLLVTFYTSRTAYYEHYVDINAAITREKHMKKWNRSWKIKLIEQTNPQWLDLYAELV